VLCDVLDPEQRHELVDVAPRTLLRSQLERAADAGLTVAASEFEYFLYRRQLSATPSVQGVRRTRRRPGGTSRTTTCSRGPGTSPTTGRCGEQLSRSGVPVESTKGEAGRGQHEINVRYAER
jgi:glutamine synthetase